MNYGVLGFEMDPSDDVEVPIGEVIALRVPEDDQPERIMLKEDDRVDLAESAEYDGEMIGFAYRDPTVEGENVEIFAVYFDDAGGVWWAVEQGELDVRNIYGG
jgi:hypothetical protein